MKWIIPGLIVMGALLTGCSRQTEPVPAEETEAAPVQDVESEENLPITNLAALKIGEYDVQPFYAGELRQGHINVRVAGPEVGTVRVWVGPEDAAGVMVVKAELEGDHYCGDMEMPEPIPVNGRLWIEIETANGERLKGSVLLVR